MISIIIGIFNIIMAITIFRGYKVPQWFIGANILLLAFYQITAGAK